MMTSSTLWRLTSSPISSSVPSDRRPLSGRGVSDTNPTIETALWPAEADSACATASICSPLPTSTARRL
jgi:hypothetical protein